MNNNGDSALLSIVEAESGQKLTNCYQCQKCSAGCPVTPFTDYTVSQIIRLTQMNQANKVLSSSMIWLCTACGTCGARCPNDINMADEFDKSTQDACAALDIELIEIPDWNCCGATSAHSRSEKLAVALSDRNILIAEKEDLGLVMPCAACYNRLKIAQDVLEHEPGLREELVRLFGIKNERPRKVSSQTSKIKIQHLLEIFRGEEILAEVQQRTTNPLKDLTAVCYYGCLLVRPPTLLNFDDPENPMLMDKLMEAIGVSVLDWSYKVDCCGASLSLSRLDVIAQLSGILFEMAQEAGAECIITACPMCHANLDLQQQEISKRLGRDFQIPIFYFTELMAIAFGVPKAENCLKKHFVDAIPLLESKRLLKAGHVSNFLKN
jgi:heterodisulfide reductase subunit B